MATCPAQGQCLALLVREYARLSRLDNRSRIGFVHALLCVGVCIRAVQVSGEIKTVERRVVFESFDQMLAELPGLALLVENAGRTQNSECFCAPTVEQKDERPDAIRSCTVASDKLPGNEQCRDNEPHLESRTRPVDIVRCPNDDNLPALRDPSELLHDPIHEQYVVSERCELSDIARELVGVGTFDVPHDSPDQPGYFC
jgi:hypothetical protein